MELLDEVGQEMIEANFAIKRAMEAEPNLQITIPNTVDDALLN